MTKTKRKRLKKRIPIIISILILTPIIFMIVSFFTTIRHTMLSQARANADYYIDKMAESIEDSLKISTNIAYGLMIDSKIRQYMSYEDNTTVDAMASMKELINSSRIFILSSKQKTFESVYVFRNDGKYLSSVYGGATYAKQQHISNVINSANEYSNIDSFYFYPDDEHLYYILDYSNIDNHKKTGKIIIELGTTTLINIKSIQQLYPNACIYLKDGNGNLLYSKSKEENYKNGYTTTRNINGENMQLSIYIPSSEIYGDAMSVIYLYTGLSLITIFIIFILLYIMVSSMNDAYNKGILLHESESRLLAAQINPHFIFNVLESINMKCIASEEEEISNMVLNLASLLRGNIGASKSQMTSIEKELGYVKYYIELQKHRFGDKLKYRARYEDEELLQLEIPRLTIQPIVENAVVHGLEPCMGLGNIELMIWREEDYVFISINDDGVGFDPKSIDEIDEDSEKHIAIYNIKRRLSLIYGNTAKMTISSDKGKGCKVLIEIPIDEEV